MTIACPALQQSPCFLPWRRKVIEDPRPYSQSPPKRGPASPRDHPTRDRAIAIIAVVGLDETQPSLRCVHLLFCFFREYRARRHAPPTPTASPRAWRPDSAALAFLERCWRAAGRVATTARTTRRSTRRRWRWTHRPCAAPTRGELVCVPVSLLRVEQTKPFEYSSSPSLFSLRSTM